MIVSEIEMNMKAALKQNRMEDKNDYSFLLSCFRAKEVELRRELTDDEAIDVIRKEVKQMQKDYGAMSGDLLNTRYAKDLKRQIDLYSIYLPKMMSYDEVLDYLRNGRKPYASNCFWRSDESCSCRDWRKSRW